MHCGQGLEADFKVLKGKFSLLPMPDMPWVHLVQEARAMQAHEVASAGGMAHAKRPHTGVPEIGRLACAIPPS